MNEPIPPPPPPPSTPEREPWPRWVKTGVTVSALLLVGWCSVETKQNMDESKRLGEAAPASRACHDFVKRGLRSPATANFGNELVSGPGPRWTVSGDVDSQNGFGATLRTSYKCVMRWDSSDWNLVDIDLG